MIDNKVRAMVLAAGVGSRLKPLSDVVPKPLIQIGGRTVMAHILLLLKKHGITNVISNTHHLADQIQKRFENASSELGVNIQFTYEEQLTGVAGGIRRCQDFLKGQTACIIMGDALTDADLTSIYEKHCEAVKKHNCIATLAQMKVEDTRQFGVVVTEAMLPNAKSDSSTSSRIVQFQEKPKKEEALSNWANTGIYFFEPRIFDFIPSEKEVSEYDVAKDLFPKLLKSGEYLQAVSVDEQTYWADLGTPTQYIQSLKDIAAGKVKLDLLPSLAKNAQISEQASLEGINEIGANSIIKAGCKIKDSVIWDNVVIEENCQLDRCIVGSKTHIQKASALTNEVLIPNSELIGNSK